MVVVPGKATWRNTVSYPRIPVAVCAPYTHFSSPSWRGRAPCSSLHLDVRSNREYLFWNPDVIYLPLNARPQNHWLRTSPLAVTLLPDPGHCSDHLARIPESWTTICYLTLQFVPPLPAPSSVSHCWLWPGSGAWLGRSRINQGTWPMDRSERLTSRAIWKNIHYKRVNWE
jgi:hypothetical protein